jgi:hypothetical protein
MRDLTPWDVVPGVLCDVFAQFAIEALNRKGRKENPSVHLPWARAYAGSLGFPQAAANKLCSTVEPDARPHGNSDSRLAGAGIPVAGGESRRDPIAFRLPASRHSDCGIFAGHLVTELRETHGSVGADEE